MRDRVVELLPLLLVAAVLIGYQALRGGGSGVPATPHVTAAVGVATPDTRRATSPAFSPQVGGGACTAQQPRFTGGLALLRAAVGAAMGDALDCEHVVDADGNTQQKTTTGLAYYRTSQNAPCFTTGWDHWALDERGGLVHWTGSAIDPPD